MLNKCKLVRQTCQWVVDMAKHVRVDESHFEAVTELKYKEFDAFEEHLLESADQETYLNYLFCLDAMNFCFWPNPNIEYDVLARAVKDGITKGWLKAKHLSSITADILAK